MTQHRLLTVTLLAAALAGGCTIVTPPGDDGGQKKLIPIPVPIPPPTPPELKANLLFVVNMNRTAVNLADSYATIINEMVSDLKAVGLVVDAWGVAATYPDELGPRLLFGRRDTSGPDPVSILLQAAAQGQDPTYTKWLELFNKASSNIAAEDVSPALQALAQSGYFDGNLDTSGEAQTPIRLGQNAGLITLPPDMGGLERDALFAAPRNLFIVVYLQSLQRPCGIDDVQCKIDGASPRDLYLQTDADGNATWLRFAAGGLHPEQIIHVAIATQEGVSSQSMKTSCRAVPGFPTNLLDMLQPSPVLYYKPLIDAVNQAHPGTGHLVDLCTLMGADSITSIKTLARNVASMARK